MPLDLTPYRTGARPVLCGLHGDLCQMGRVWPLPEQVAEMHQMIREAKIACGMPVEEPDPYTVDVHKPQTKQQRREFAELIAEAEAKVAAEEAEFRAGGHPWTS